MIHRDSACQRNLLAVRRADAAASDLPASQWALMDSADRGGFGSDSKIESASAVDREEEQREIRTLRFAFQLAR